MFILLRLFLASLLWVIGYKLFSSVLPITAAAIFAGVLAVAELFGGWVGGNSGAGGGIRALLSAGATLVAWPLASVALQWGGFVDRPARIAVAAAVAAAFGVLAAGHGAGRETARLWAVVAASGVALYSLIAALMFAPLDPMALSAGAAAVGVAVLVARQSLVWPDRHERVLLFAGVAAFIAASVCLVPVIL